MLGCEGAPPDRVAGWSAPEHLVVGSGAPSELGTSQVGVTKWFVTPQKFTFWTTPCSQS